MKSLTTYIIFLTFSLFSCKNSNRNIFTSLVKTNKIKLICFKSRDPIRHILTDKESIQIFVDIFKNEPQQDTVRDYTQIGLIEYYFNDSLLLSIMKTSSGISYAKGKEQISDKISYRAGMYFDGVCNSTFK